MKIRMFDIEPSQKEGFFILTVVQNEKELYKEEWQGTPLECALWGLLDIIARSDDKYFMLRPFLSTPPPQLTKWVKENADVMDGCPTKGYHIAIADEAIKVIEESINSGDKKVRDMFNALKVLTPPN